MARDHSFDNKCKGVCLFISRMYIHTYLHTCKNDIVLGVSFVQYNFSMCNKNDIAPNKIKYYMISEDISLYIIWQQTNLELI